MLLGQRSSNGFEHIGVEEKLQLGLLDFDDVLEGNHFVWDPGLNLWNAGQFVPIGFDHTKDSLDALDWHGDGSVVVWHKDKYGRCGREVKGFDGRGTALGLRKYR